jgi:hypothetical protein
MWRLFQQQSQPQETSLAVTDVALTVMLFSDSGEHDTSDVSEALDQALVQTQATMYRQPKPAPSRPCD